MPMRLGDRSDVATHLGSLYPGVRAALASAGVLPIERLNRPVVLVER